MWGRELGCEFQKRSRTCRMGYYHESKGFGEKCVGMRIGNDHTLTQWDDSSLLFVNSPAYSNATTND